MYEIINLLCLKDLSKQKPKSKLQDRLSAAFSTLAMSLRKIILWNTYKFTIITVLYFILLQSILAAIPFFLAFCYFIKINQHILCGMNAWLVQEISLPLCCISQLKAFQKVKCLKSCLIYQWNKKVGIAQANAKR